MARMGYDGEPDPRCTCDSEDAPDAHPCPFQSDVHNDAEFKCNCCEFCTDECAADI